MSKFTYYYYLLLIAIVLICCITYPLDEVLLFWPFAAFAIFLGPILAQTFQKIKINTFFKKAKDFRADFKGSRYFVRPAQSTEIEKLYEDFIKLFGNDLLNLNELKKIHKKNKNTILLVCKESLQNDDNSKPVVIGFFELFPIMEKFKEGLLENNLDGRILSPNKILGQVIYANNYYLGSIGILPGMRFREKLYKAAVLKEFTDHLYQINIHYPFTLFTRPVTPDGLRLVVKYKFKKTDMNCVEDDCIWKLEIPKGSINIDVNGKIKFRS